MTQITDLLAFLDASPSPYHAAAESGRRLTASGSTALDLTAPWGEVLSTGSVLPEWMPALDLAAAVRGTRVRDRHIPRSGAAARADPRSGLALHGRLPDG